MSAARDAGRLGGNEHGGQRRRRDGAPHLYPPLRPGFGGDRPRRGVRIRVSRGRALFRTGRRAQRRGYEAAWRRLHQAHQDDHRARHLRLHRPRHRGHAGLEAGRPRRHQGAGLFRDRDDVRARRRADYRQLAAARCRHERRPRDARHQGHRDLRHEIQGTGHRPVPPRHHPIDVHRRLRGRQHAAGAFDLAAVRVRVAGARSPRGSPAQNHRDDRRGTIQNSRLHHAPCTDRRLRGHGLHHRQVRARAPSPAWRR